MKVSQNKYMNICVCTLYKTVQCGKKKHSSGYVLI